MARTEEIAEGATPDGRGALVAGVGRGVSLESAAAGLALECGSADVDGKRPRPLTDGGV
jgi:hypothetical protein